MIQVKINLSIIASDQLSSEVYKTGGEVTKKAGEIHRLPISNDL